ncbi:MAG: DsbA family protein [Coriobacteriales bacterium]|nr:DsbA family protein [Coriobacteriales bacterium]
MPESTHEERPRVLIFFDYACPFCYLDWARFERLQEEFGADLILSPYELRPMLPEEGVDLEEIGAGHSARVVQYMERMAREAGFCYEEQSFVPNSHLALALGEFARDVSPARHFAVHEAIYQAYYCDGANIGDLDVLLHVAAVGGLDVGLVRDALDGGVYDERLHQFRHLAMALGVQATPSALICNELFIGTRPYQLLADAVGRCMGRPRRLASGLVEETVGREESGEPATIRGT